MGQITSTFDYYYNGGPNADEKQHQGLLSTIGSKIKSAFASIFDPYSETIDPYDTGYDFVDGGNRKDIANIVNSGVLTGIYGAPYQFLQSVDPRIGATDAEAIKYNPTKFNQGIGREYAEKIVAHWPLLFITPCRQQFMDDATKKQRKKVIGNLIGDAANFSSTYQGKYYTTKFAYKEYYNCVNRMIGQLCYFLGIEDCVPNSTKDHQTNWYFSTNEAFKDYYAAAKSVVFYVDGSSMTTVEDTFENETTNSSLESELNSSVSPQARELIFLLGQDQAAKELKKSRDNYAESAFSSLNQTGMMSGSMLGDLANTGINTILNGGKIIFPKIWNDSSYSKSYSFTIKLRSPDHDKYSIFLNILVPYIHLLCLVLPQTMKENQDSNSYQTPFLVRAYSKGQFNIDMGMITSLSVSRGGEGEWSDDGLPTSMDISMTIEDLYSNLTMSNWYNESDDIFDNPWKGHKQNVEVATNSSMMDYLANLAGLNIADEEIGRQTRMLLYLEKNSWGRIGSSIHSWWDNNLQNIIRRIYE